MKQVKNRGESAGSPEEAAHNIYENETNKMLLQTIPSVEEMKLPFLLALQSGREKLFSSIEKDVARYFDLSAAAQAACLNNAKSSRFENRMKQTRAQLHDEDLIELPHRKKVKLTEKGRAFLIENAVSCVLASGEEGQASPQPEIQVPTHLKTPDSLTNSSYKPSQQQIVETSESQDFVYQSPEVESSSLETNETNKLSEGYSPYAGFPNVVVDEHAIDTVISNATGAKKGNRGKLTNFNPVQLKSIALILGIVGLFLCLTKTFCIIGVLCGIAALAILYFSGQSASAYKNAKAATGVSVASVVFGIALAFGTPNAAPPVESNINNSESIAVAESLTDDSQGSLAFAVTSNVWAADKGAVNVIVDGHNRENVSIHDYYTTMVGETYLLEYGPGDYSFTIDTAPLSTGDTIYGCETKQCSFDGKADQVITIALVIDTAATETRAAEKEAAAKAEQDRIAAQQKAEAEARARAEQEAAAAAVSEPEVAQSIENAPSGPTNEYTVYIGKSGECYHTSNCRTLKKTKTPISVSAAIAQGYRSCKVCNP